jgi:hypothetical protein
MVVPTFLAGPLIGWLRDLHQAKRKVKLTVHRAITQAPAFAIGDRPAVTIDLDNYHITVTNASRSRDIVVTHIWLDTSPPIPLVDGDLPRRLRYGDVWETAIAVSRIPVDVVDVEWLARCVITPDDKVIKSRPRRNVPPAGTVPRGGLPG